ncbi:MAG: CoA transferase [Deltaproteobacteria bacterium]|nr:CoA transferase [Deltaproteobacteria bacterium]
MADSNTDNLPLGGIRVLDLGTMTPGKYCTHLLSDLGADVIRIERHFAASIQIDDEDLILNRNKRSIALNLSTDEAKQVFYKLAQSADVILESHRPGVTSRMGVDYETIKKTNPRIIYCSLSGFGQDGPYAHLPAFDVVFMAIGGLLGLTAEKGQPPRVPRIYVSDAASGLLAAVGILTALVARQRTGLGQFVDIAMLDGVLSVLSTVSGFLLQHVFCGQLHQGLYQNTG